MDIRIDDLRGPEIAQLLREHLQSVALHSPPESIHALNLEALRKPDITLDHMAGYRIDGLRRHTSAGSPTRRGQVDAYGLHVSADRCCGAADAPHSRGSQASLLHSTKPGNGLDGCLCACPQSLRQFWVQAMRAVCGLHRGPV